jgi:hypothetical protein
MFIVQATTILANISLAKLASDKHSSLLPQSQCKKGFITLLAGAILKTLFVLSNVVVK